MSQLAIQIQGEIDLLSKPNSNIIRICITKAPKRFRINRNKLYQIHSGKLLKCNYIYEQRKVKPKGEIVQLEAQCEIINLEKVSKKTKNLPIVILASCDFEYTFVRYVKNPEYINEEKTPKLSEYKREFCSEQESIDSFSI